MIKGRKGSFFVPLIVFGAIITLISLLTILLLKAEKLDAKSLGEKQMNLFRVYQAGEKHLNFVDEAAGKAVKAAALRVGRNGLEENNKCGNYGEIRRWSWQGMDNAKSCAVVSESCYPPQDLDSHSKYFSLFFRDYFEPYINDYNLNRDKDGLTGDVPKDYSSFKLEENSGRLQLVGLANSPVVITDYVMKKGVNTGRPLAEYRVKPSFRSDVAVNFVSDSQNLAKVAKGIAGKSKDEALKIVASADKANGLDWDEGFSYDKKEDSCTRAIGPCPCCVKVLPLSGIVGELIGMVIKKSVDDGSLRETIPYDIIDIPMSVKAIGNGGSPVKFHAYDDAAKAVAPKELEYKFALNWITPRPEDATTDCSCSEGYPC